MYLAHDFADPGLRIAAALDRIGYIGLCVFVAALAAGGDSTRLGGMVFANWIIPIPIGFMFLKVAVLRRIRQPCPIHRLLAVFTVWAAASSIWTVDPENTVTRIGTYLGLLLFVALIWESGTTSIRVQGLIGSYVFGSAIAALTTLHNYSIGRSTSQQEGADWDTLRYSVEGVNADEIGLVLALSIPMALYLLVATKNRFLNGICWVQLVAGFAALLLSGARGAMIALLVGVVMMCGPTISRMSKAQRCVALLMSITLPCCAIYALPKTSLDRFLSIGTEITQGTMTHRTLIWAAGMEVFRDHPFLGVGSGAYGAATTSIIDVPLLAHNTFISILVELGIVGALLMAVLLSQLFYGALRLPFVERRTWLALMVSWTVGASSVSWENRKTTWFLFGLLAAQVFAANTLAARKATIAQDVNLSTGTAPTLRSIENSSAS